MKRTILALIGSLAACAAPAAPHLPKDDSQVLERLPARRGDPAIAELRALRGAALARRYFELALAEGDPRYVGYAQAALQGTTEPAAEVAFVRGLLRQYRHDFAGALSDFDEALRRDPEHVGARSWRAAVFMVGAQYEAARAECRRLEDSASELLATGCRAYVDAATGQTRAAYQELRAALERRPDAPREIRLWTLTRLAEMAWRLQEFAVAEAHFRAALALGVSDQFLLAAYADFLLERGRAQEVRVLLRGWARADTLLLRLALAEKELKSAQAPKHVAALSERFQAAALRGERLHLAEEARFALALQGDAKKALALALENWKSQREPRDAALVLESALAAREPAAAAPALRWLRESGFESAPLERLAASLR